MRSCKHALGLSSLVFTLASPALAQTAGASSGGAYPTCDETKVTASDSQAAHSKYLAGKVDDDEAKYDSAIAQFRDAYSRDCTKHELLIIISRAYELKGDRPEAIRALETYLARVPSSPDADAHRARIENLKKADAEEKAKAAAAAASAPPPARSASSSSSPLETPPPSAEEPRGHTALPWVVAGVVAAAIAAGAIVVATAPELPANCDPATNQCTKERGESDADFQDDQHRAGASQNQPTYGYITIAAGGALLVGGLVWHFLEPTGPREGTSAKLAPVVTPRFAGLSLGGRF